MMNSNLLKIALFAFVLSGLTFVSCEDDPIIDPNDGINVADGLYFAPGDEDPEFENQLTSEVVEDDGFASQERNGFVGAYNYLEAGTYRLVEVKDKEITAEWGGTAEAATTDSGCELGDYSVVAMEEDGAAVSVSEAGLYRLTFDAIDSEMTLYQVESVGIIGSATEGGWGSDTQLDGSANADGGSWSKEGVILRAGDWKLRFNCNWGLNQRHDDDGDGQPDGWTEEDGYQAFTNFGGTLDNLETGGANFAQDEDGEFTVTVTWDPLDGFTLTADRTGDAPDISFVPDDHQWAVVGDAINAADDDGDGTPDGWQVDVDLNYEGFDSGSNTYTWESNGAIAFGEGAFKFRTNDSWDENIGWGMVNLTGDIGEFSDDGGNVKVSAAGVGDYIVTLTTSDDGETYSANFEKQ